MIMSLELGSSDIKIFDSEQGLAFYEPSIALLELDGKKSQVIAFGKSNTYL